VAVLRVVDAVAHGGGCVEKELDQRLTVVGDERAPGALELGPHLGEHLRGVDPHGGQGTRRGPEQCAPVGGSVRPMSREQSSLEVEITVNGTPTRNSVEARTLLVHYLREVVGLTGTNIGCDTTSCGACTVLLDGESVKSCTVLAVQADGHEVTTIEGLADGDTLHPMQEAFREHHGLQCGYCTPGMVMASVSLAMEQGALSDGEVREGLEGNLCRCTGYQNIVAAVMAGSAAMAGVVGVSGNLGPEGGSK